jgi:opacity protein-like surface antigen
MNIKKIFLLVLILSFIIYPQQNREQALKKGGWSGGLAGWLGWENYDFSENLDDANNKVKVDGFNFIFSSRNGSIVEDNSLFGFDFQWRERNRTNTPDPNPNNTSESVNEKVWFLGLWARYYIPFGGNFAMYFEGSGGYSSFSQKDETITDLEYAYYNNDAYANGFAYNAGIGISHFVSQHAAFELTGRYEGGSLNGENTNYNGAKNELNVKIKNIFLLFGFQIYLR